MMTRDDLLGLILAAVDDEGRIFDHAEIATWPPGSLDEFCRRGLIRRGRAACTHRARTAPAATSSRSRSAPARQDEPFLHLVPRVDAG
jgi:hypothetical protein